MSLLSFKQFVERLPEGVGRPLATVPYVMRLGPAYSRAHREIQRYEVLSNDERRVIQAARLKRILDFAFTQIPFYRDFYSARGFKPADFRSMDDWESVPIVTKADMQDVPLGKRLAMNAKGMDLNTGGTSGAPLQFRLDRHAFAREWAHMHRIWMAHGYHPAHLKLTFRGKHFTSAEPIRYNAVHNEYVVNTNCAMDAVANSLNNLSRKSCIRWIHGYPSLVAEFANHLSERSDNLASHLRERLYGVLLGSEYPAVHYRDKIEGMLSNNVVSWYGHSEMAVLAGECVRGVYTTLPTYGYAEAVNSVESGDGAARLVATSFDNFAHPFIRYDTGDLVESFGTNGGSLSFRIREGRVGDFVIGHDGRKIALTALIFGRHHPAFSQVKHLQVRQDDPGSITLLIVPIGNISFDELARGFDLDDAAIDWHIELREAPLRTATGKTPLKVSH